MSPSLAAVSAIQALDEVYFFPTLGVWNEARQAWQVAVHGIVSRPALGRLMERAVLGLFRRYARIRATQAKDELFRLRASPFLAEPLSRRKIIIRLGARNYVAGVSGRNGHFGTTLEIAAADLTATADAFVAAAGPPRDSPNSAPGTEPPAAALPPEADGWLSWRVVLPEADARVLTGRAQLLAPGGRSVISDVDDTIKVSRVLQRKLLVRGTFSKPFRAVAGMADVYRQWAEQGAAFHYVSASPWQLFGALEAFRESNGFPAGAWEMKHLKWRSAPVTRLFVAKTTYKRNKIEPLLLAYPGRQFVFVGDSTQHDPEVYGGIARKHPEQLAGIYIRAVQPDDLPPARLARAFAEIAPERIHIFRDASELSFAC
ncbi:MAG TPA: phosphatase domain-containing protein [Pirellulales bacterium]|jgi:hypothetical protein|nr:phosphatase domain-containing protein [Pirellulales bacterium]